MNKRKILLAKYLKELFKESAFPNSPIKVGDAIYKILKDLEDMKIIKKNE